MADLFENPVGLNGFEFVEFASTERGILEPVFTSMGFSHVATHRSKSVDLWRQGDINFVINYEPKSGAAWFAEEHGPTACGMAFRVRDAHIAYIVSNWLLFSYPLSLLVCEYVRNDG